VIASPTSDRLSRAYHGRRVLVTGHTGFKGAWLCAWLLEMGAETTGYALEPPTQPSLFERILLAKKIDHRIGDVRDASSVHETVEDARPDIVVHMAAEALVRRSYESPADTFATNVMGTVHVLDAVRRVGRPCVVIVVTSDKCYEPNETLRPHREGDPLGGHDPYSASKGCAEIATTAYRRSFFPPEDFSDHGVALASVRAGNVIGGGDWARDRILPDIVRAVLDDRPVRLRNPHASRPWQHVLDALSGYLWLGARMLEEGARGLADVWNFGPKPDAVVSVQTLTERVLEIWQRGRWEDLSQTNQPHEAPHLQLATEKAARELSWRPVFGIDEAIDATVEWYKRAESSTDMSGFTAEQIRGYMDHARAGGAIWATAHRIESR